MTEKSFLANHIPLLLYLLNFSCCQGSIWKQRLFRCGIGQTYHAHSEDKCHVLLVNKACCPAFASRTECGPMLHGIPHKAIMHNIPLVIVKTAR